MREAVIEFLDFMKTSSLSHILFTYENISN